MNERVVSQRTGATLKRIVRTMVKREVDCVVLVDRWDCPRDIVTQTDVFRRLDEMRLQGCMAWFDEDVFRPSPRPLITLTPGHSVGVAVDIMDRMGIHHIPIIDEGELVGLLTGNDVLRHCAALHRAGGCGSDAEKAMRPEATQANVRAILTGLKRPSVR